MAGTNLNDSAFIPGTSNPYQPKLVITPGASAANEAVGKYTQNGNSIRVEFSDAVMNITVKDNTLTGETVYTDKTKPKEKWEMQKFSNKPNSVNSNAVVSSGKSNEIRAADLVGTWEGTFAGVPCVLKVDNVEGTSFYGTLIQNGGYIAVVGEIDPNKRVISFKETKVISLGNNQSWILGNNKGVFWSNTNISGTGVADANFYQWNLTKK